MQRRFLLGGPVGVAAAASVLLALILAAGFIAKIASEATNGDDSLGGPGLPVVIDGEQHRGETVDVAGELVIDSRGCFLVATDAGSSFAIWPRGFATGGDAVITADDTRIERGDRVTGRGILVEFDTLVADNGGPDGYWASIAGFCQHDDNPVLVLGSVD